MEVEVRVYLVREGGREVGVGGSSFHTASCVDCRAATAAADLHCLLRLACRSWDVPCPCPCLRPCHAPCCSLILHPTSFPRTRPSLPAQLRMPLIHAGYPALPLQTPTPQPLNPPLTHPPQVIQLYIHMTPPLNPRARTLRPSTAASSSPAADAATPTAAATSPAAPAAVVATPAAAPAAPAPAGDMVVVAASEWRQLQAAVSQMAAEQQQLTQLLLASQQQHQQPEQAPPSEGQQ